MGFVLVVRNVENDRKWDEGWGRLARNQGTLVAAYLRFLQRGGKWLKGKEMRFALLHGSAKSAPFAAQGRKEWKVRDGAWGS
jgi:hypothetical protein